MEIIGKIAVLFFFTLASFSMLLLIITIIGILLGVIGII